MEYGAAATAEDEPGLGLSNLEFTGVAEVLGRLEWASRVFNYHARMYRIWNCCSYLPPEQKQRWLVPLLEGEIGSAFAMTEPEVASSDPVNLTTRIERDGDEFVINGRKWFASNASHANCQLLVVVGVTDPDAAKSKRQSLVLVPRDTPGVEMLRTCRYLIIVADQYHPEFTLTNVRVPVENLLGEQGASCDWSGALGTCPPTLHACDWRV